MTERPEIPAAPPLASSLKGLLSNGLGLLQVRLELFSVEAREELARVGGALAWAACAWTFFSLGLGFLSILITVALWESHRLLALTAFSVLFLTLGGVAFWLARQKVLTASRLFEASLAELQADREQLRS